MTKEIDPNRYPIGYFEFDEEYRVEEIEKYLNQIEEYPSLFCKALKTFSEKDLDKPYREGGWTIRVLVHHVAEAQFNIYGWVKSGILLDHPTITRHDPQMLAMTNDYKTDIIFSIRMIEGIHARFVAMCRGLSQEILDRKYYHPVRKVDFRVSDGIKIFHWHAYHHLEHIRRAK